MGDLLVRSYPTNKPSYWYSHHINNTLLKRFRRSSGSGRLNWVVGLKCKRSSHFGCNSEKGRVFWVQSCSSSSTSSSEEQSQHSQLSSSSLLLVEIESNTNIDDNNERGNYEVNSSEYLANDFGWKVRRLANNNGEEIRNVATLQAQAFHEPTFLFDDFFFQFFQAEVLAGLNYKLRNSPPNRSLGFIAKKRYQLNHFYSEAERGEISNSEEEEEEEELLVGVVDVTALRDQNVLPYLPPDAHEYLYISGIAVSESFRRKKIATVLLKACDTISILWGFKYLVLRAYEDDHGARELYSNASYTVVSGDPPWTTTWIGRKRRVLMIKQSNQPSYRNES